MHRHARLLPLFLATVLLAPAAAPAADVSWTNLRSATPGAAGAIRKLADGNWYGSATSTVALTGDGRVEFRVVDTGANPRVNATQVCLNSGALNALDPSSLEYCLAVGAGYAAAYVQGRWLVDVAVTTSDLLAIGVDGGAVRFYRNGVAFHAATLPPAYPLVVYWTSDRDGYGLTSAAITSATTSPPPAPPPPAPAPPSGTGTSAVSWTRLVDATAGAGGTIRRGMGGNWYSAGVSSQTLTGDGRLEFQVNDTGANPRRNAMNVCLNAGTIDVVQGSSLEYCIGIGSGYAAPYVQGRWMTDLPVSTTDRLAIGVESGVVRFYRNGTPFHTAALRPTFPLEAYWTTGTDGMGLTAAALTSAGNVAAPANRAPTIAGAGARTLRVGEPYAFTPSASDPDGDRLTFSVTGRPAWLSFDAATGTLRGTPTSAHLGTWPVTVSVSDGSLGASLAFAINVVVGNRAPTITGATSWSVASGQAFSFAPTASDPDGDPLTFSATGLPAWARLDPRTGRVSGTPTAADVATSWPRITVSDGTASASLALTLTVTAAVSGRATLTWTPPTTRTDGSALGNLAGYRIYYGTAAGALSAQIVVPDPRATAWVVENLSTGTWYFAMTSVDAAGLESPRTAIVSLVVR